MLPKVLAFQCLLWAVMFSKASSYGEWSCQFVETTELKVGWFNHIVSKWNGDADFRITLVRFKIKGQWSEWVRGRWVTMESSNKCNHAGLEKKRSSHS